jgi:dienelactone hydrolase
MRTTDIDYQHDGKRLVGQLAVDSDRPGRRPAVLVCHEATGLTEHAKNVAGELARAGYVAFALDYFGGGTPPPPDERRPLMEQLAADPVRGRTIARAGLAVLLASEFADPANVAAIGFCFGGTMALELARDGADLRAVVGFHSGLGTSRPGDAAQIRGSVLVCIGADDPIVPPEQRLAFEDEMRAGGVDWRMNVYGGAMHSFTNPAADGSMPGIEYEPKAHARSWRAMLDLFDEVFVPGPS